MAIDLCIVAFNNAKHLPRLLDNLFDKEPTYVGWNLFIADNDSSDGTKELLQHMEAYAFGDQPKIYFNANIGYARACNHLAAQGQADIIGFLNGDVWFKSEVVRLIESSFDKDPTMSILGPKQRDERGYITHAGIEGTNTRCQPRAWHERDPKDQLYRVKEDMVSVAGSAYFIRRSVWDALSNCEIYRQQYPNASGAMLETDLYYEETYLSYHARAHGYRVVYDGTISIGHSWHGSSRIGSQTHKFHRSQKIFREACDFHGIEHD